MDQHLPQTTSDAFTATERQILDRLIADSRLTSEQVQEVLAIKAAHRTPLLDILGAMNLVHIKEYARNLADVTENPYISPLIESDFFTYDESLIRRWAPSIMARHLFCPLQLVDDILTVLTVSLDDPYVTEAIYHVVPNAQIVPFIGTERDIRRLLDHVFGAEFLHKAVHHLRETTPEQSASRVLTRGQKMVGMGVLFVLVVAFGYDFWGTAGWLIALISLLYLASIAFKFLLSLLSWQNRRRKARRFSAEELSAIPDAELPLYSILVPVYKEPSVVPNLLKALARMDYPQEKLDVLILMEEKDPETIAAAKAANPPAYFRFIIVPDALPRTKPKACNYGLNFCRGEYVTIYDAEDIPEPDQLRKAVAAFRKGDERLICVQSALNYYNANENYLTRMFTLEYTYWFDYMLPGLDRLGLPIPLGGTSNHFRMEALRQLGAWDPFNVTEDADLGIRAAANGYTVGVIQSTTYEEANKSAPNWIRQRSRWIKGYMQTWLVHNRQPWRLLQRIGLKDWLGFQLLIGGTVWVFLMNPWMWAFFLLWIVARPFWMSVLFRDWVWWLAFTSLVVGNGMAIALNMLAALDRPKNRYLFPFALTNPLYWVLHSIAAYKGLWQLIRKPFYWEKTTHGLTQVNADAILDQNKA